MKASEACLCLIKEFEGCRLRAYRDGAGILTVGFGSTENVFDGMVITPAEAFRRLQDHLMPLEVTLEHLIKHPLTQNQQDAIISLVYNIGSGNFGHSNVLKHLNAGELQLAADAFREHIHDHAGKVEPGLVRRREAERALFLGA